MQTTAPHSCTICKYPLYAINNQFYCCNLAQRYCTICRGKSCIRCNKQIEKNVQLPKCRMCYNKYEDQLLYEPVCQCYYCAKCVVTQFFSFGGGSGGGGNRKNGEFCTFTCGHRMRVQAVEEFIKGRFCILCGKKAQTISDYELITGDRCCFQCFRWDKKKIQDLIMICLGCQKTLKRKAQIGVFNQGVLLCDLCAKQSYLQQERVQKIQQSRKKGQQSFHSSNRGINNPDVGTDRKTDKLENNFIGQQPNQNYNQQNRFYQFQSNSQNPQLGQPNESPYKIVINQSSTQPQKPKTQFQYSNPPNYNYNSPNPMPSTNTSNPANTNNKNKPVPNPVNSQQPVNIMRNTDQIGSIRSPPKSPKKQSLSKDKDKNKNNLNSQTNSTNTSSNTIANTVKDNSKPSQSREKSINQNANPSQFSKNNDKQPEKSSQFQQVESVLQFQQVHTASYSSKPSTAQTVHANANSNKPNTLNDSNTSMTVSASTPSNSLGSSNIPSILSKTAASPSSNSNLNSNLMNQSSNPNIYMQNIQNSKRTVLQRFPSEKDDGLNPNSPTYPAKRGIKKHLSMDTFVEKMKIDINIDQEVQSNIRVCKECGYQLVKDQCFTIQNSMHNIDTYCKLCYTIITNSQALGFNMQRTMLDHSRNTRGLSNQKHKIPSHLQKSISSPGNGNGNINVNANVNGNQPLVSKSPQTQTQTQQSSNNLLTPTVPTPTPTSTTTTGSNNRMKLSGNFQTHQRMTANVRVSDPKSMYREECVQCGSSGQALIRTGDRGSMCFSCYYKSRGK